jgi:hypothetical protein
MNRSTATLLPAHAKDEAAIRAQTKQCEKVYNSGEALRG